MEPRIRAKAMAKREPSFNARYRKFVLYTDSARRLLKRYRQEGIFKAFLEARNSKAEVFQTSGKIKITKLTRLWEEGYINSGIWRVDVGGSSFFVKETDPKLVGKRQPLSGNTVMRADLGPKQFLALRKLRAMAKDFPHIEVAKPLFAWQDRDKSFLVTRFYHLEQADYSKLQTTPEDVQAEFSRFKELARNSKIYDLKYSRAFYDRKLNKMIMFDPRWADAFDASLDKKRKLYWLPL